MDLSKCSQWGCTSTAVEWEAVDISLNTAIASYCPPHVEAAKAQNIPGIQFRKITQQEQGATPMSATPVNDQMAPPDAVYDDIEKWGDIKPPTTEETSTNLFWRLPGQTMTFDLQTTVRGAPSSEQLKMHIRAALDAILAIVEEGGKAKIEHGPVTTVGNQVPPPPPPPPQSLPQPGPVPQGMTPALPVGAPQAPAAAPPQAGVKPIQVLNCVKIKIAPRTDGQSEIHFFQQNAQFPNLKLIRQVPELVQFMSALGQGMWTEQHMRSPGEYTYACKVQWQESDKLNSKGNPYRNVVSIAP